MTGRWPGWFALGVLRFRLSPDAFWALSLAEWRALCAALGAGALSSPDRQALDALIMQFPDGGQDG